MPRGTTLRNVRVDDARWAALDRAATWDSLDRSEAIRRLIDGYVKGRFVIAEAEG